MLLSGHWTMTQLAEYLARGAIEVGIAPIPHAADAPTTSVLYASGWAVPPNVVHKRLAIQLAAFLASEEAQRIRAASRLEIPTLEPVARAIADGDTTGLESAFLRATDGARMTWGARVRDFHEVEDLAFRIMDRRLLRGEDLTTAATEVARQIDRVVGR
jgi:ABC-type glycerol-3-phosphate transport system substrate-binding protein